MNGQVITFKMDEDGDTSVLVNTKEITPNELGICPKCGSDSQVWKNQNTGKLTCHRFGCENLEL
jgi:hypothetical protein